MGDIINPKDFRPAAPQKDAAAEAADAKVQALGRQLLSSLYMLVRTVKIHDADNAIFNKPLETFRETINALVARDGQVNIQGAEHTVYLNGKLLKIDMSSLENVKYLMKEFQAHNLGGFAVDRPVTIEELRTFINVFAREDAGKVGEDGAIDGKVMSIRMAKFRKLQDFLEREQADASVDAAGVDRRKYSLVAYARAVYFLKRYLDHLKGVGRPVHPAGAARLVHDLVDVCFEQRTNFLGLTSVKGAEDYNCYHAVNTALLNIVFGAELGLNKEQLSDLALTGLFHDLGRIRAPDRILMKAGPLSPGERVEVEKITLHTIKILLRARTLDRSVIEQVTAVYEHRIDFIRSLKDPASYDERGRSPQKSAVSLFGRILAITHVFDALTADRPWRAAYPAPKALEMMFGEMRQKFDPFLIRIFVKAMAFVPTKHLQAEGATISVA
jgi:HD-GYP domain-containing protein (c-di-GMP phosphodiesterase class II)